MKDDMFRYLNKYVGTYRVMAHYDEVSMSFPRNELGKVDDSFDDLYIPCGKGKGEIRHTYTPGILSFYCPSMTVIKNIAKRLSDKNDSHWFEVDDCGDDGFLYFKDSDIAFFAKLLKAQTIGKGIKPYSKQNLSKDGIKKYVIPDDAKQQFSNILSAVPSNKRLSFAKLLMKEFENNCFTDKLRSEKDDSGLSSKEFIHSCGLWGDFIKYAESRVSSDFGTSV